MPWLEQNVLVANFGDRVVLFDTGMGTDTLFGATTGKLGATLKQAGIDPANVDAVVMSHAHIDHCGGLVADDGSLNFPNAQYYLGQADFDYWTDDAKIPANYPARPHFLGQARKNLLPVKDRIHFYKDGEEILPGITALAAPGHTVSHSIFMINSGNDQLCYVGDLAHHPGAAAGEPAHAVRLRHRPGAVGGKPGADAGHAGREPYAVAGLSFRLAWDRARGESGRRVPLQPGAVAGAERRAALIVRLQGADPSERPAPLQWRAALSVDGCGR